MKSNHLLFAFIALIVLGSGSCGKPDSCITASSNSVNVGDTVFFDNCSTKSSEYYWDFGDNTYSQQSASATHYWETAGTYSVKLVAYRNAKKKKSDEASTTVTVSDRRDPFIGTWHILSPCDTSLAAYDIVISKDPNTFNRVLIDNLYNFGINSVRCDITDAATGLVSNQHSYFVSSTEYKFGGNITVNPAGTQLTVDVSLTDNDLGNILYDCVETATN